MPEQGYQTFSYRFESRGLVARYAGDSLPEKSYVNMENLEVRQENAISTRFGRLPITVDDIGHVNAALADLNIHTLGRLKSINGNKYRYAGSGQNLYRRAGDTNGAYTKINGANALSGNRFSVLLYRPDFSSFPYVFFADGSQMLKDSGTLGTAQKWGIFPPTSVPTVSLLNPTKVDIDLFETVGAPPAGYTFSNFTGATNANHINTTLSAAVIATGLQTVTLTSMADVQIGMVLSINTGGGSAEKIVVVDADTTSITAFFANTHANGETVTDVNMTGAVAASTTATVSKSGALNLGSIGSASSQDDDVINLWVNISNPTNLDEMRILFDVGDGSFTKDYYMKTVTPASYQSVVDAVVTGSTGVSQRVFSRASGQVDLQQLGFDSSNILPQDDPITDDLQPQVINTGLASWSRIQVKISDFVQVGLAGQPLKTWANVNAFRVSFKTNSSGSITAQLDDMYLYGGNGPDVFGGVPYDYRVLYYNINTGAESLASQTMIEANWVSPRRQPVKIDWIASTDGQVTHARVYRRGGTISSQWYLVGEIAVGTTTFSDVMADSIAVQKKTLEINNEPPVTSTLNVPADTTLTGSVTAGSLQTVNVASVTNLFANQYITIGTNTTQETVIASAVGGGSITAFFQYAHGSGERVYAVARQGKPLNLGVMAFERAWLAGDTDNPNLLYYSKRFRPESFPSNQYIEIGVPSDPIMAVVETRGNLFVFTLSTIYQVVATGVSDLPSIQVQLVTSAQGGIPTVFKTGVAHGLAANFAWCEVEGEIWYLAYDGIYAFRGGSSQYISESIAWLFNSQSLGPLSPLDPTQISQSIMAHENNEIFLSYINLAGLRKRLIYSLIYKRWRNDDVAASAMLFEKDTYELVIAKTTGMIFRDRHGDYDNDGYSGGSAIVTPIQYTLQTEAMDFQLPKNNKVFNEFTLDANTSSQDAAVSLLLDNTVIPYALGNVNTNIRKRVDVNIASGLGQSAQNVALKVTGFATSVVDLFVGHLRALVEAEFRKSFDSYWVKYGTDEYKLVKQGWFEYVAAAQISFSCYIDGNETTPEFTFTLSASTTRTALRVRFPAVKAKMFRWVATSASDFQFYSESQIEVKQVCGQKGYAKAKMAA